MRKVLCFFGIHQYVKRGERWWVGSRFNPPVFAGDCGSYPVRLVTYDCPCCGKLKIVKPR
jgi:hypothetical protein